LSRIAVVFLASALLVVPGARAAVIVVETTAVNVTGPLCDLGDAMNAANTDTVSGGCVEVEPNGADVIDLTGLEGTISLDGHVLPVVHETVTLRGPGADVLTIDGEALTQVLVVDGGTLTVEGVTLANGKTAGSGGCIGVDGAALVLRDSRVTGCDAADGGGIAVAAGGTARIERSLVDANTASDSGAGLVVSESFADVVDSTFSGNQAQQAGGGIATVGSAQTRTRIASSTLAAGKAPSGGNLYTAQDPDVSTELTHVLLAAPKSGGNCGGRAVTSNGFNLSSDATCDLGEASDHVGAVADLDALADNGGPTPTYALLANSDAIDAGDPTGCRDPDGIPLAYDQRGPDFPRRTDANDDHVFECDIGAYETAPEPLAGAAGAVACGVLVAIARGRRR